MQADIRHSHVNWMGLCDDSWRVVFNFLGMDAFTLRRVCSDFQTRIVPLNEMPTFLLLAQRLVAVMTRLDLYEAPSHVLPQNLLSRHVRYNEWGGRIHIWPPRSNARRTHLELVQAPLGILCQALCALHLASCRLKVPFCEWINRNAVILSLKYRALKLFLCESYEQCPGSPVRFMADDEIAHGIQVFYDLNVLRKHPFIDQPCRSWYHAACNGLPGTMRVIIKIALNGFTPAMQVQRVRALMLWRTVSGQTAFQGARFYCDDQIRHIESLSGLNLAKATELKTRIRKRYAEVIALIAELRRTFIATDPVPIEENGLM